MKRRSDPRFQIIVLNRISTDNLVENILGERCASIASGRPPCVRPRRGGGRLTTSASLSFAYELSKPYIMYRNDSNVIHGIWFFEEPECDVVSNLLTRYARRPRAGRAGAVRRAGGRGRLRTSAPQSSTTGDAE